MNLIKNIRNNRKVVFDKGKFDDWGIYIVEADGTKNAALEIDYFTDLKELNKLYENNKVYKDFLKVYFPTDETISSAILTLIDDIVLTYQPEHQPIIEQWFTVIYAETIANENKKNTLLKKRVKHLGVHQDSIQDFTPADDAHFNFGKKWRELNDLMKEFEI